MVSARSAILSASTAIAGSTALEHVNSLSPGVRTGEITIEDSEELMLLEDPGELIILTENETIKIVENEALIMHEIEEVEINN